MIGTLANDILCEYVSRGLWVFPPEPALRLCTDIAEFCIKNMPKFYPFNIRGLLLREAGATMAQEIGFSFCSAFTYINDLINRGLDIDQFGSRISFFFCTGLHFFEEAAKYRASRRIWARLIKERYNPKKDSSMFLRFTGSVGGSYYRVQEPENNIIRGAYGLLGNVLGGVQGMLHPALDEPFAIPTEKTAILALRTQQICAYETGVMDTVDPLGGSYYIETLTNQIEKEIIRIIEEIEGLGGAVKAIESGYMQRAIAEEAYRVALEEASGERVIVGINKFQGEAKKPEMRFHQTNPEAVSKQIKRLRRVKAERNNSEVSKALDKIKEAVDGTQNLMEPVIEAVKSYASVGEIMRVLKECYGEFKEPASI